MLELLGTVKRKQDLIAYTLAIGRCKPLKYKDKYGLISQQLRLREVPFILNWCGLHTSKSKQKPHHIKASNRTTLPKVSKIFLSVQERCGLPFPCSVYRPHHLLTNRTTTHLDRTTYKIFPKIFLSPKVGSVFLPRAVSPFLFGLRPHHYHLDRTT